MSGEGKEVAAGLNLRFDAVGVAPGPLVFSGTKREVNKTQASSYQHGCKM